MTAQSYESSSGAESRNSAAVNGELQADKGFSQATSATMSCSSVSGFEAKGRTTARLFTRLVQLSSAVWASHLLHWQQSSQEVVLKQPPNPLHCQMPPAPQQMAQETSTPTSAVFSNRFQFCYCAPCSCAATSHGAAVAGGVQPLVTA